jgi:hypothetical protein
VALAAPALATERILLPSAHLQAQVTPPLRGNQVLLETRLPFKATKSVQRVLIGIDGDGAPVSVDVVQRLTLSGLGDYTFAVPGPVTDVVAAPGSASDPGLRQGAILWSGFSPGKKVLAARASLRLGAAATALPLRLTITRQGGTLTLTGENVSGVPGDVLVGPSSASDTAAALDKTRQTARLRPALQELYVGVPRLPKGTQERIWAPLHVTGELRFAGGRRVPLDYVLGDGRPLRFVLIVPGVSGDPKVRIVVESVSPAKLLTPPSGSTTWAAAVRAHRVDPAQLLEIASRARLAIARAIDYETFVVNPDPRGVSSATYVYETAPKPAAVALPASTDSNGNGWTAVAFTALALLGAGGLMVLWAHH